MSNTTQMQALYDSANAEGRGVFCPRKGIYLIIDIYYGNCYGKSALMAKAYWKLAVNEKYNYDFTVELQLESFKGVDDVSKYDWIEREILVESAVYDSQIKKFDVKWMLIEVVKVSLDKLNSILQSEGNVFVTPTRIEDVEFEDFDDFMEY